MLRDADKIAAFWLWFGGVALLVTAGGVQGMAGLIEYAFRRIHRNRLRRRNIAVVEMIEVLQSMHEVESGGR